ncbi:MAG: class I SAM-dependent methyltransferase [Pseudomonas sp.]|nr:MAG: class I SAM-dependent methyltransferase [Pseudomonas sp.]
MKGKSIKNAIKNTPVLGRLASKVNRKFRKAASSNKDVDFYMFDREVADADESSENRSVRQLRNLLNYTKTSQSSYSAEQYPAGYHTIHFRGQAIKGQRDPVKRFELIPIDFSGKRVLDIGCNQGGMLRHLSKGIKSGVGIDFDSRMINTANWISRREKMANLDFFVFDLQRERLDLIEDFLPEGRVDVVFLLAVCMWIDNWKKVIDQVSRISEIMVFETNGTEQQQCDQIAYLNLVYKSVILLSAQSDDDPEQKKRQLYICEDKL